MKYTKQFIQEIFDWVAENGLIEYGGATLMQLCEYFHIHNESYYNWMEKSEFSEGIEKAKKTFKENLQRKIEISLAKCATGYEIEDVQTELVPDADGRPVPRKQVKNKRHVAPNVAAGIFLLNNLDSEKWQNKQHTTHDGEIKHQTTYVLQDQKTIDAMEDIKKRGG